jgi:hypothetical protein
VSHSVVCYPQPNKKKSRDVLEAFAAGCGGRVMLYPTEVLEPGPAAFYGVVGIETAYRQAIDAQRDVYYVDNAFFDVARGKQFRVGKNELQRSRLAPPNWDRLHALGVEIKPWRRDGRHVVVVMQSDHFMENVARWPGGALGWQQHVLEALKPHTDRLIVLRHWTRDKLERAKTLHHDLQDAWAVVTHMSAAANEAVLAGVPVFVTGPCAALPMGLSDLSAIERPRRPDGRREWAAGLAGAQWSLDEFKNGMAWRALNA